MLTLVAPAVNAQAVADCVSEADAARRLACYDGLFRQPNTSPGASTPASSSGPAPSGSPAPSSATAPAVSQTAKRAIDWPEGLLVSTAFNKTWELTPETKRGTFVVRTYLPNFVLPLHSASSINATPGSPTHPAGTAQIDYRPLEAKLQISLRAKVAEGLVLPDADLWLAHTQRSLWQVWNPQASSPFRSNTEITALVVARAGHHDDDLAHETGVLEARLIADGLDLSGQQGPAGRAALVRPAVHRVWRNPARLQPLSDQPGPGLTLFQF